jgi:pimeloyl-ACP methyl ester carboxylesterase
MAGTVHRRSLNVAAAAAALLALLTSGTSHAATSSQGCPGVTQPVVARGTTPVLFVHGINSTAQTWDGNTDVSGTSVPPLTYVQGALGSKVTGYTYNWSAEAGGLGRHIDWVFNPAQHPDPGQQLAKAISCIAQKSGHRVIVIAHSMGGLLTKDASNYVPRADMAAVFTLGTPYRGSWLASAFGDSVPLPPLALLGDAIALPCTLRLAQQSLWACLLVAERDDTGMAGMRLDATLGWNTLPPWPAGLPVYTLAADITGTWERTWPAKTPLSLSGAGDIVSTKESQRDDLPGTTVTCTIRLGYGDPSVIPDVRPLGDALAASSCLHQNEPYNKTLLDYIIGRVKVMLPTSAVSQGGAPDWYNASYTMTCGGAASHPFTLTLTSGRGVAPGAGSYSSFQVHVEAVTQPGDLTGPGSADTAVLLYCSPQPSNFYNEEVQIFRPDGTLLAELPRAATLPGTPLYDSSRFSIKGGQLVTGMKFYGPGDSHASGPSIYKVVTWSWNGSQFTHSPISLPQAAACPKAGPGVPAGLATAVAQQVGNQCGLEIDNLKADPNDPSWVLFAISPTPGSITQGGGGIAHQVGGTWPVVLTGSALYWCSPSVPAQVVADFGLHCP